MLEVQIIDLAWQAYVTEALGGAAREPMAIHTQVMQAINDIVNLNVTTKALNGLWFCLSATTN